MDRPEDRRQCPLRPAPESLEDRLALNAAGASYVAAVYKEVLHRAATAQEISYWTGQFQAGNPTYNLANGLVNSPERRVTEINLDYQILLHRAPTAGETAYYQNAFANGATTDSVLLGFLTSAEYQSLHPGVTNYVDALYSDVLNRDADPAGEAYQVNAITQGESPAQVVTGFLHSPEREGELVDQAYADVLHRADTPVEHQHQVDLLVFGGSTPETLIIGALTSPEFLKNHSRTTS